VPELITKLFARKVVTMGFTGTYTEEGAERAGSGNLNRAISGVSA
jgi:hypothetical protein